ncbi:aminodeoxychorismate synthase component I [Mariprofundus sp. EBB-1]|uniref:anthranilate synthase component I family protein n=1 Tax=Mariprofundus sp. EBB-1 TaxID=2650971 RepID=UPI000EF1F38E|nr:chorismate-binding protein [Mariprofundus sp. EBB-1]RLL55006.1 aminodeoxychorismate synthase component I [Mariprofundus sp. EBB-1]
MPDVIFRVIKNRGRKLSAYGLFSASPDSFAALLEDPSGNGRQFLVSKAGSSTSLRQGTDQQAAESFFHAWKQALAGDIEPSPAIRCLFYAAYEASLLIEHLPSAKSDVPGPVLWTLIPDYSICFDGDQIHLAARNEHTIRTVLDMLDSHAGESVAHKTCSADLSKISGLASEQYTLAVEAVKSYIAGGDVFQANIARFWSLPFRSADLQALYHKLRQVNSAPFSSYVQIDCDDESQESTLHLISASPERLFRTFADGEVDTRPIAGTRRRAEGEMDDSLRAELLLSEKERAEHIMLVDLERNDLGRVCRPGSVEVNEQMVIEQYATVQHIVSNVRGYLAEGMDVVDLFKAMFPGGTITGCPKVRCMEIIHELENSARGPYTGGLGYVSWDGSSDMNILIRTFWHFEGQLNWAAGAGIVADSDPQHELIETDHKAEGLLRALF